MSVTYAVELGAPAEARTFVESWLATPQLRRLIDAAGGTLPRRGTVIEQLRMLSAFSERWDFRGGGERLSIVTPDVEELRREIEEAAEALGMRSRGEPTRREYDHAVVLGGTAAASYYRTRQLAEFASRGIRIGDIGSLGAMRSISDQERAIAADHGARANGSEFDTLASAATTFFPPAGPIERVLDEHPNPHLTSALITYPLGNGFRLRVLAAASRDPARRATTFDNYDSYGDLLEDGQSLLVCTSSIYLPYQFFAAALAMRDRRIRVELVGFPPEWLRGTLTAPHNYLQEIRSAIQGALRLVEAQEA